MADLLQFKTFGVRETEQLFDALPAAFQKRVLNTAARSGAVILRNAAKANLAADGTIRTGLLQAAIDLQVKRYKSGVIWAGVGANRKVSGIDEAGKRIVPANYIHLVETGSSHSKAAPFLRPAADANRKTIQAAILKGADKGLAREIKKFNRSTT